MASAFYVIFSRYMPGKTNVYIDDLNLFYGALKGTPYKWLDLNRLYAFLPDINNGLKAESVSDRAHSALRSICV